MILIDTHIWIWWLTESSSLKQEHRDFLNKLTSDDIAISIISVWEVAKAVENKKLQLKIYQNFMKFSNLYSLDVVGIHLAYASY